MAVNILPHSYTKQTQFLKYILEQIHMKVPKSKVLQSAFAIALYFPLYNFAQYKCKSKIIWLFKSYLFIYSMKKAEHVK